MAHPTLQELKDQVFADIRAYVQGSEPSLRQSTEGGIGTAQAGGLNGLYDRLDFLELQLFDDTATGRYLERRAATVNIFRKDATFAEGEVVLFTGTDGSTIPVGAQLTRADGVTFIVDAEVVIAGGVALAQVTAAEPGSAGDTAAAVVLTLASAIPGGGVNPTAIVQEPGLTGGGDTETDEGLRSRLLQRRRNAPAGGADWDYERWALESDPGVTRAFIQRNTPSLGNVRVLVVDDANDPILPDPVVVTRVYDYITDSTRAPNTDFPVVEAPVLEEVPFILAITPDTSAVRSAVADELDDLFKREGVPGETMLLSQIRQAIGNAAGLTDYTLTTPAADVAPGARNRLLVLGVIAWG
jgi:uncharacterized phage protein gp47/JayE